MSVGGKLLRLFGAALTIQACAGPLLPSAVFRIGPPTAALTLRLGNAARSLQYLRVADWDEADGELVRDGQAPVTATSSAVAGNDGRGRSATLTFSQLPPGSGYRLRVTLVKQGHALGTTEQSGLTLTAGQNILGMTSLPEAQDQPTIAEVRGIGPYVTTIPGQGTSARLVSAQDVLPIGGNRFYFLDNGRLGLVYEDSAGGAQVRTVAGQDKLVGAGLLDGTGTAARFNGPRHLALAAPGVLYVADAGSNAIRKVVVDTKGAATVTTVAGTGAAGSQDGPGESATFANPSDVLVQANGDLIVADTDNHKLRAVTFDAAGHATVSTLAGTGAAGFADGAATVAQFRSPGALAPGPDGTIYVGDSRNFRLRILAHDGQGQWTVSTLAGSGRQAGFQADPALDDGDAATARFGIIVAIRRAPDGSLYVADGSLRHVVLDGQGNAVVTTVGIDGNVTSDFVRVAGRDFFANGIALNANGDVLIAGDGTIKRVTQNPDGSVAIKRWVGDAVTSVAPLDGPARADVNLNIVSVAPDGNGYVYLSSRRGVYRLKTSNLDATPELIAGDTTAGGYQDGVGANARFGQLNEMRVSPDGTIYVGDTSNFVVRRLVRGADDQYTVSTAAGVGGLRGFRDGPAGSALFGKPGDLAVSTNSKIYILDADCAVIRELSFDDQGVGTVTTVAGRAPPVQATGVITGAHLGYADGPASTALMKPVCARVDPDGNLVFNDDFVRLRKVTFRAGAEALVSTLAGVGGGSPSSNRPVDGIGTAARFVNIQGVDIDRHGAIYVGDDKAIRRIFIDAQGRAVVSTFLGAAAAGTSDGGPDLARFGAPDNQVCTLAFAPDGDLFITEFFGKLTKVRRITGIP